MTFRSRLLIGFLAAAVLPLVSLAFIVRQEMTARLTRQFEVRVESEINRIEASMLTSKRDISQSINNISASIADDNTFRLALGSPSSSARQYIIDYAGEAMSLTGLSVLQILDGSGRILSSGHFRNEFDRADPALQSSLNTSGKEFVVAEYRTADSVLTALSVSRRFVVGDAELIIAGGIGIDQLIPELSSPSSDIIIDIKSNAEQSHEHDQAATPRDSAEFIQQVIDIQYVPLDRSNLADGVVVVRHPLSALSSIRRSLDTWFIIVGLISFVLSLILAAWLSVVASKPVRQLTDRARQIDLNRLRVNFHTSRQDELGELSRTLGTMVSRLRRSRRELRDAERRAALGDIARQVNHDIRNGLTPIKNILRHFDEVVNDNGNLGAIYKERKRTIDSSVEYLSGLADQYSRLSTPGPEEVCNLREILAMIADELRSVDSGKVWLEASEPVYIRGNSISIRRIFENLVVNSLDSLTKSSTGVGIFLGTTEDGRTAVVRITDDGSGISHEDQERIFDDFFTTKEHGSGLGLSIVRRIVMDLGGTIRVKSEPGQGTEFITELPATTTT